MLRNIPNVKTKSKMGKLVTLVTYTYSTESYVLVARLEAAGITCHLKNEHLLNTQQFLSNAVVGLEVQVSDQDLVTARQILKEVEKEKEEKEAGAVPAGYVKLSGWCPQCESSNVFKKKKGMFSFGAEACLCGDCGHQWKQ